MNDTPKQESTAARRTDYERTEASAGWIAACGGALALASIVILLALIWIFDSLAAGARKDHRLVSVPGSQPMRLPNEPRLEGLEPLPETAATANERIAAEEYQWVDQSKRIARIPLADAMKVIASTTRGGAAAPPSNEQNAARLEPPGASSSGRIDWKQAAPGD